MDEKMIPLSEIVDDLETYLEAQAALWCDRRLFSLVNRALNLCGRKAHITMINEEAVRFSVIPFPEQKDAPHEQEKTG